MAEEVLIPPAVHRGLLGKFGPESEEIDRALRDFISVRQLKPLEPEVEVALVDLDEGERQAIGLASTLGEDVLLLLDNQAGRKAAKNLTIPTTGFKVKGCLGIILDAVKEKHVSSQRASKDIDNLIDSGYRIADDIVEAVKDAKK